MKLEDDKHQIIRLHKERYLGYNLYFEYLLKRLGSRYEVYYRVLEEFLPVFSKDDGCLSVSEFRKVGTYKNELKARKMIKKHHSETTPCELLRDFR